MTAQEYFEKGIEAQRKGDLNGAVFFFQKCIALNPSDAEAIHFLGLSLAQNKQFDESLQWFEKALIYAPKNPIFHNNCANAYKNIHDWHHAIEHYQKAIHYNKDYAEAYNNLASVYDHLNQQDLALEHYSKAINLKPEMLPAHINLGILLLKMNRLEDAKIQFNNVVTLNPKNPSANFYLGSLALEAEDYELAEERFKTVLSVNPEHAETLCNLGVVKLKQGEPQQAIDYFTYAIAVDEHHIDARNNLAATFIHHDRYENALMHYDVLLKDSPNNIEYNFNMGVAQMALGHLNDAITHFECILKQEPTHIDSLKNLAAIYLRMEKNEKAVGLFEKIKGLNQSDESSDYMLAALKQDREVSQAPLDYVKNLFDNYAIQYDEHLVKRLNYSVPGKIAEYLQQQNLRDKTILDLGCGTGLSGQILRPHAKKLIGVDLAPKMIETAKNRACYDALMEKNILDYLKENNECFDLIVCADVIPYFGQLETLFELVKSHLNDHGLFIFNTEIAENDDYVLQTTARFCHSYHYIDRLTQENSMKIIENKPFNARIQQEKPLKAILYVLTYK